MDRIIDAFPTNQQEQIRTQLASSIVAVLSQILLVRASGKGRIAAFEVMVATPSIQNLIRENKTYRIDSAIQTGKKYGMQLLDEHLWLLYEQGQIGAEECVDCARQPGLLQDKIDMHRRGLAASLKGEGEEDVPVLRT